MVSVVIATYNGKKYIIEQLESIRNQTKKADEVIISDDGSFDGTIETVREYINFYKLYNWKIEVNNKKLGFFDNFFMGIKKTEGDIIFLADQDDIWDLKKIEKFCELYDLDDRIMMIQSNVLMINENGVLLKKQKPYHRIKKARLVRLSTDDICRFAGSGFTMSFQRTVAEFIFYNQLHQKKELYEYHDILLGLTAVALGDCVLERAVVDKHRLHKNNATQKFNAVSYVERTKRRQLDIVKKRERIFFCMSNYNVEQKKKEIFLKYSYFANLRVGYLIKFGFYNFFALLKNIDCYNSKFGFLTDTMYSLGMEKLLLKFYKLL